MLYESYWRCPVNWLFVSICQVTLPFSLGLTSWRFVTGPDGSVWSRNRCALTKKNSLFCSIGPPNCVVMSAYFVVFAGSARVGFLDATDAGTLFDPRPLLVPKKSNRPE